MMISAHFSLDEFETSDIATRHGIDNTIPDALLPNIKRLVGALEQARQVLGGFPISISSGYRCRALNTLARGSAESHHMQARAVDFICPRAGTPLDVCRAIANSGVQYDQLIHEFGRWVHMSVPEAGRTGRGETLTIDRHGTREGLWGIRK